MQPTNPNARQRQLDQAAISTATVVARAIQVRGLTRSEAVAQVAAHTGESIDFIEAMLDRASLMVPR